MSWENEPKRKEEVEIKKNFSEHYQKLLGEDYEKFIECSLRYLPRAFRINTLKGDLKIASKLEDEGWELTPVPWCKGAFWIKGERRDIGNLVEHQLGQIYIQDPASMIPPLALDPQPGDRVLDMCASPGSKTSQAAAMMKNTGIILANDADGARLTPLGVNLQKLGVINTIITKGDGRRIKDLEFDKIMCDVPCSATGTIRRSLKSLGMWNLNQIKGLSNLQFQLAQTSFDLLAPGGVMTYSTCTLEPLENEVVVSRLLLANENAKVEEIKLKIKKEKNFTHYDGKELHPDVTKTLRIHPYTNNTEGFFVARIRKNL